MNYSQWYIACFLQELEKKNPLSKKILGKDLVIFRNSKGEISVLEDRCCHRNVQLSLGEVKGENIVCGYHGWQYNCDGKCAFIPSLPKEKEIPRTIRIKKYTQQIRHQAVWVWMGNEGEEHLAQIPPLTELDDYQYVFNFHFVKSDLRLTAESLFDAYHIGHVHKNSIGTFMGNLKDETVNFHLKIGEKELHGEYDRINEGSIWEKIYFGFEKKIRTHFSFWFPHTSKLDIRFKKRRMVIFEHFYPVDEETICMYQITAWERILNGFPLFFFARSFMLNKSNRIVREDLVFLENNKKMKQKKAYNDLLITPSDEVSVAFIKLWNKNIALEKGLKEDDEK